MSFPRVLSSRAAWIAFCCLLGAAAVMSVETAAQRSGEDPDRQRSATSQAPVLPRIDLGACVAAQGGEKADFRSVDGIGFTPGMRLGFAFFGHAGHEGSAEHNQGSFDWSYQPALVVGREGQAPRYHSLNLTRGEGRDAAYVPGCASFAAGAPISTGGFLSDPAGLPRMNVQIEIADGAKSPLDFPALIIEELEDREVDRRLEPILFRSLKILELSSIVEHPDEHAAVVEALSTDIEGLWRHASNHSEMTTDEQFPAPWFCLLVEAVHGKEGFCRPAPGGAADSTDSQGSADLRPRNDVSVQLDGGFGGKYPITVVASPDGDGDAPADFLSTLPALAAKVDDPKTEEEDVEQASETDPPASVETATEIGGTAGTATETKDPSLLLPRYGIEASRLREACSGPSDPHWNLCMAAIDQLATRLGLPPHVETGEAEQDGAQTTAPDEPAAPKAEQQAEPEAPRIQVELPLYQIAVDAALDTGPRIRMGFLDSMETCEAAYPDVLRVGEVKVVPIREQADVHEGAAGVIFDGDRPLSRCTEGSLVVANDGQTRLRFAFERFIVGGPSTAYVLSLASGFRDRNMELPFKQALSDLVVAAAESDGRHAASIFIIDGSRSVRTMLTPEDVMLLAVLDPDRRQSRLRELMGTFSFAVRTMEPVRDTAALYDAIEGSNAARIVYVVDSRREQFRPAETGPIYTWLLHDEIPVTVLSLGGCDGWISTFASPPVGAGLDCIDLDRSRYQSSGEILGALNTAARR